MNDRPDPDELGTPSEPTEQFATAGEPTERFATPAEPTEQIPWPPEPAQQPATPTEQPPPPAAPAERTPEPGPAAPEVSRRRGPHAPTVLLGLICLVVAALVIGYQSADITVDWSLFGPGAIVGAGVVLVLLGLVGVTRRER